MKLFLCKSYFHEEFLSEEMLALNGLSISAKPSHGFLKVRLWTRSQEK